MIQKVQEIKQNNIEIYRKVYDTFNDKNFPCIYGKLAFKKNMMYAGIYKNLSNKSIKELAEDLQNMSSFLDAQSSKEEYKFNTFIAIFDIDDSCLFYYDVWIKIISTLYKFDKKQWKNSATKDLNDPNFKFSFDDKLWYPVLITPNHFNLIRKSKITILSFQPDQTFILNKQINFEYYQMIRKKIHQKIDNIYQSKLPYYLSEHSTGKGIVQFIGCDFEKNKDFRYPNIFNDE